MEKLYRVIDRRTDKSIEVRGRKTLSGNVSFEMSGTRYIIKPTGEVLHLVRFAYGRSAWEADPFLVGPPDVAIGDDGMAA